MAGGVVQLAIADRGLIAVAQCTPRRTEATPQATFDAVRGPRMEGQPCR